MFIITNTMHASDIDASYDILAIVDSEEAVTEYLENEEHGRNDEEVYVHEFQHVKSCEVEVVTEYNLNEI